MGEVWRIPITPSIEKKPNHPAPFPIRLAVKVVKSASVYNDIISDPFMGSGTTAIACEQLGRRWIGIEISEKYCEISAKRIERERQQLKLFPPEATTKQKYEQSDLF